MARRTKTSVPRRRLLVAGLLCIPVTAATAFAATLAVTPARLTTYAAPTTVPTTTCSVGASHDTYASSLLLLSNFGTAATLQVQSATENKRTFVRFNLATCSIPSTAEVKSARLRLSLVTPPAASRTYAAHRISGDWSEATLNWNDQPGVAGTATASIPSGTSAAVLEWPVTTDVQAFVAAPATNFGWRVSDSAEGALTTFEGQFTSKEGTGTVPQLVVTYYP